MRVRPLSPTLHARESGLKPLKTAVLVSHALGRKVSLSIEQRHDADPESRAAMGAIATTTGRAARCRASSRLLAKRVDPD